MLARNKLTLHLESEEQTLRLGRILAEGLPERPGFPIMLNGDLGSGKTTLVRGLVSALPGSEAAEVASPSFNIYNVYPTRPEVVHFDIYRLEDLGPDDTLLEYFSENESLVIVEWAQYLDSEYWPDNYICLSWQPVENGRTLTLEARGLRAVKFLEQIKKRLTPFATTSDSFPK